MESIGELLEPLTTQLYDWRVEIAIGSVIAAVLFVLLAIRFDWFAAARRHPARTGVVVAAFLVVALPIGWYTASPLFLRTSLVEAAPVVAPSPIPVAAATDAPTADPSATPEPTAAATPTEAPFEPAAIAEGEFEGTDDFHFGHGTATIIEVEPGRFHLRLEDFSVRNGPDLFVYLSPDAGGYDDAALELGRLKATDGSFGYDLPEGVDPGEFESAIIWCKQFAHLFAVAPLDEARE
jgi:hypothetical protein